jgi:hypothetical protein
VRVTGVRYTGVDIVPELVEYLKENFQDDGATFLCANITSDRLPQADLCLIRQVFQHLSNAEIGQVLANISHLNRVLVSEEIPDRPTSFNLDKAHGPDVRAYYGSGIYLERPPFSIEVKEMWTPRLHKESSLRTVLLER